MNLYERIENCVRERKISITNLEKEVGLGNGTIGKWKDSVPKADKLYLVAKYLGKSVEYFLTGIEEKSCRNNGNILTNSINESPNSTLHITETNLSKQEQELVEIYRNLSLMGQVDLITYALKVKNGGQ